MLIILTVAEKLGLVMIFSGDSRYLFGINCRISEAETDMIDFFSPTNDHQSFMSSDIPVENLKKSGKWRVQKVLPCMSPSAA